MRNSKSKEMSKHGFNTYIIIHEYLALGTFMFNPLTCSLFNFKR